MADASHSDIIQHIEVIRGEVQRLSDQLQAFAPRIDYAEARQGQMEKDIDGMEAALVVNGETASRVESAMIALKGDMSSTRRDIAGSREDVAEIRGMIKMPAYVVTISGVIFALVQLYTVFAPA